MSETPEPSAADVGPQAEPVQEAPAPASAAEVPVPPVAARGPGAFRRLREWFWRGAALAELKQGGVFVPPRAREFDRRARLAAELAGRALEPSGPLRYGAGDAVACELYREALFWALSSLAATRNEPTVVRDQDLRALFASADRAVLLQAAPDPAALAALEAALLGTSFADFAELPPEEQTALAWKLRRFVEAVLSGLDSTQAALDRLRLQRFSRVGAVVVLLFTMIPVALVFTHWSDQRRDIAAGKPWKASSQHMPGCVSPEQNCSTTYGFFFHTAEDDKPWLMIDLGSKKSFSKVVIENRTNCCADRAIPLVVEVSNDKNGWKQVASRTAPFDTWRASFSETRARYVRVRATRKTWLHLSRVRVLR